MRKFSVALCIVGVTAFVQGIQGARSESPAPVARWDGQRVVLTWKGSGPVTILRSVARFQSNSQLSPITSLSASGGSFRDERVASGVTYFYRVEQRGQLLAETQVAIPFQPLTSSSHPELRVDKRNYTLEVVENRRLLKRYPIVMGREPFKRKLQFDNASTPEGRYKICGTQPKATYYRAYDIDYPNQADRARFQLLGPTSDIGGEIQIHGRGIARNWTFGCMALRDSDMDELFAHPEIGVGTEVLIYGGEVSLNDVLSDRDGPADRVALGRRQRASGLKVTCLWDVESRRKLTP